MRATKRTRSRTASDAVSDVSRLSYHQSRELEYRYRVVLPKLPTALTKAVMVALATLAVVAVVAPSASAADKRCANVRFRSPYTHSIATARVAIRRGNVSCATARPLIKRALATKHRATGETWHWFVSGWRCSSGGDGTITICTRKSKKIEATTPTPGGYWPQP